MEAKKAKSRDDIPEKYKWKLSDLYSDIADWEQEFKEAEEALPEIEALKSTLISSADALFSGLELFYEIQHKVERLYVYARMRRDENNADNVSQALTDRANGLIVRLSASSSFINPLLLSAPEGALEKYIDECEGLKPYAFYLRDLVRSKKHVLSESEERILSLAGDFSDGAHDAFTMLDNADMSFGELEHDGELIPLSHASYQAILFSDDRELRKKAYYKYFEQYKAHINTLSALYSASVKKDVFYAKARGYSSARAGSLFSDDIPESLYDALIEDVHSGLPAMYRYVALRKRALKLDELHMYDVYAPIAGDVRKKYPFEDARDIVLEALKPLGEDYISTLKKAFSDGWIDVYETKGKTTGAYSWGAYGTHPYVLLNHTEELNSVFTLAHELGHAMHSYRSNAAQPYPTADYRIFVAEIASTVNETLLTKYLLAHETDKSTREYILNHYLDQIKGTVYRQTMFAEFEKLTHDMADKGEPLTPKSLSDAYEQLNELYFGPDMLSKDDTIRFEWARIPHFYRAFYVYKYATGLSTAVAIVEGLKKPGMHEKYMDFLSAGGSAYPLDIIKAAGVDFSTVVKSCMRSFDDSLKQLEEL